MNTYLVNFGGEGELATFSAETVDEAIAQFIDWEPILDNDNANLNSINQIMLCVPVDFDIEAYRKANLS